MPFHFHIYVHRLSFVFTVSNSLCVHSANKHVMLYKALPVVLSYSSVDEAMIDVESSAGVVSPFKKILQINA